jgi:alkylation response protein AidB-like acyl-CoA dehydrogenase
VLQQVQRKRHDPDTWYLVGEIENALVTGQMAAREMIGLCANYTFAPEVATANEVLIRKTIAAQTLLASAEKALETVGGAGIFRGMGLERLLRDIRGAQFHPLPAKRQHRFTGRIALGFDPVG